MTPHPRGTADDAPSFREALRTWTIGLLGFGGPTGQMAPRHRILVEETRWVGETRFLHAFHDCMLRAGMLATLGASALAGAAWRLAGPS